MAEMRKRTSMSVPEMGRILGLGKTESYWLIKKNYFKTILVGNTMRVMIDSFEEWYANQFKYQKVDGTPPGEELKKTTYSMEELGQRLGLKEATAYELVAKGHFDVVDVLGKRRVTKESFERWYASQTDYRTVEDQELDADIMASTYGRRKWQECLGYIVRPFTISLPMKILSLSRLAGISELPKRALKNGITIRPATSWRKIDRKGADYMASIVKRKKKYSVVYTYTDENGNKRQKWETFETNAEAKKRKLQVEYEQESGTFIPPSAKTVNDLLDEYMSIYGVNTWAMSTYESRKSLIANYIRPLIGDMKLEDVTPRIMDKYYRDLLSVKAVSSKYVKARTEYLTPHTVREVHKTLRNAFNQAVKWELMTRNPVEHATLPKEEHKTRDIWTAEVLQKALEACDDDILRLAINLAFSCSLRMGELLGLTWDCIDISPTSIELGQASIFVEKELQRVNREAMADLDGKDIMFKFPPTFASTHTALVLKTPKTKTSVRKVFLPKTVAEMLVQRKADIEELKDLFGDEFVDFNLVFCSSNGKPIEGQVINRAFNKLIEEKGLPKVVFHSLRHSSITYKLKLNGGDMKSVQGDSGHAQVKMVADVYSHIIDDDRRLNAERMEAAFYSGRQATPEPVQPAATESSADDKELLLKLLQNPEMAALLKSLAKTL